eukprot:3657744-Amphidinium_carterae.1
MDSAHCLRYCWSSKGLGFHMIKEFQSSVLMPERMLPMATVEKKGVHFAAFLRMKRLLLSQQHAHNHTEHLSFVARTTTVSITFIGRDGVAAQVVDLPESFDWRDKGRQQRGPMKVKG